MQSGQRRLLKLTVSAFLVLFLAIVAIGQGDWSLGSYRLGGGSPSGPATVQPCRFRWP